MKSKTLERIKSAVAKDNVLDAYRLAGMDGVMKGAWLAALSAGMSQEQFLDLALRVSGGNEMFTPTGRVPSTPDFQNIKSKNFLPKDEKRS